VEYNKGKIEFISVKLPRKSFSVDILCHNWGALWKVRLLLPRDKTLWVEFISSSPSL